MRFSLGNPTSTSKPTRIRLPVNCLTGGGFPIVFAPGEISSPMLKTFCR
jgi:hypothetical protein